MYRHRLYNQMRSPFLLTTLHAHFSNKDRNELFQRKSVFFFLYACNHPYIKVHRIAYEYNEQYPNDLVTGSSFVQIVHFALDMGWIERYNMGKRYRIYKSLLYEGDTNGTN